MSVVDETLSNFRRKLAGKVSGFCSEQLGASALEFSIFASLLIFGLLNTVDISVYVYKRMQVENATEMAAQAAWKACNPSQGYLPATTSCPDLTIAITGGLHSTTLGGQVALQTGSPSEGYYCINDSGALQYVSAVTGNPPQDCSATGHSGQAPGDYIQIAATFAYTPMFPGITVAKLFTTPITKTSMMRLN